MDHIIELLSRAAAYRASHRIHATSVAAGEPNGGGFGFSHGARRRRGLTQRVSLALSWCNRYILVDGSPHETT